MLQYINILHFIMDLDCRTARY